MKEAGSVLRALVQIVALVLFLMQANTAYEKFMSNKTLTYTQGWNLLSRGFNE